MGIRQVPCRHTETGAEGQIPATALQYFPGYEPVEEDDRKRYGYDKPASDGEPANPAPGDEAPAGDPAIPPAPKNKPAASGKNTPKE